MSRVLDIKISASDATGPGVNSARQQLERFASEQRRQNARNIADMAAQEKAARAASLVRERVAGKERYNTYVNAYREFRTANPPPEAQGPGGLAGFLAGTKALGLGRGGQVTQTMKILTGGGALMGASFATGKLAEMAENAAKMAAAMRAGEIDSQQMFDSIAKSVPILGDLYGIGLALSGVESERAARAKSLAEYHARQVRTAERVLSLEKQIAEIEQRRAEDRQARTVAIKQAGMGSEFSRRRADVGAEEARNLQQNSERVDAMIKAREDAWAAEHSLGKGNLYDVDAMRRDEQLNKDRAEIMRQGEQDAIQIQQQAAVEREKIGNDELKGVAEKYNARLEHAKEVNKRIEDAEKARIEAVNDAELERFERMKKIAEKVVELVPDARHAGPGRSGTVEAVTLGAQFAGRAAGAGADRQLQEIRDIAEMRRGVDDMRRLLAQQLIGINRMIGLWTGVGLGSL